MRQKIYEPAPAGNSPRNDRYHADLFAGKEMSWWEKHQMQQEIARTLGRAA